jgi:hypothetical protein
MGWRRGQFVKFNTGSLLRTDLKSRYESNRVGIEARFLTVNEARTLEDREPRRRPRGSELSHDPAPCLHH